MYFKFSILIVLVVGLFLSSCSLDGESNYTPNMSLLADPKNQKGDSLKIYLTATADQYLMDTIQVGDTVSFALLVNAFTNNVTALYLTQSADSVTRIITANKQSMDSVFLETSDYKTGKYFCKSGIPAFVFPFKYIARVASKTAEIGFTVTSDAKFETGFGGSNSISFKIKTPIKNKIVINIK